jgi:2-polyprenyl-3-methyl-5-hydroxy-6-metoxy-1,4-benzoquinol methylase
MKNAEYYNSIYSVSEKYLCHYSKSKYYKLWKELLKRMTATAVLDIGCGTGQLGEMLVDNGVEYYGFDISSVAIGIAKSKGLNVWVGDIYDDKNFQNNVDAYLCMEVLEHLDDDMFVLKYKPLYFSVPSFMCDGHVRCFKSNDDVFNRYKATNINKIGKRFIGECR